jgi:hypothetical protein
MKMASFAKLLPTSADASGNRLSAYTYCQVAASRSTFHSKQKPL